MRLSLEDVKLNKLYPNLRFLVIDDFENFRSSIRLMLSSFGATQVELVSTAEDALNKCRYEYFDVVLCDFNLGQGKNGQQILEELRVRKRLKHTHLFVMITAETSKEVVLGAREYQPDAYIAKPITRTVLEQRLGQLLTQQRNLKAINREIDLENYPKAISLCQQKIESGTRYRSWCFQTLAQLYTKIGDTNSAEKIYADILKQREVPWAKIGMGHIHNMEQQHQLAKQCFSSVISSNPNMIEAYDGLYESCISMGQNKEAQSVLQEAVSLSPRLIVRQEKLGNICLQNNDLDAATTAFRNAVTFGANSVHEKVDNYLSLGTCLADLAKDDHSDTGKAHAAEALDVLNRAGEKYSGDETASTRAILIEARVYQGQGKSDKAEDALYKAECLTEEVEVDADLGLEMAKTYYSLNKPDKAQALLTELSKRFAENKKVLAMIDHLLDEPEDLATRMQARELNKQAIQCVDQQNLSEAIQHFQEALKLTPTHAALNLNFLQVLVRHFKQRSDASSIHLAKQALERLNHLPEQHNQFKRLKHFRGVIDQLSSQNMKERAQ